MNPKLIVPHLTAPVLRAALAQVMPPRPEVALRTTLSEQVAAFFRP
ncbi:MULTISPECIES: hypothetical protein [Rathayibacter]|uniref:Uncharacterized protein n=1 Tax=Rathayibacter iranicus NCPPB 2253 = VKM Ac-1602 TaxID=1328868 RepID=A0ABX5L9U0_9MICO|nr:MULTISPECIES: hypothetical protein [Rathayibacter]MWV32452.1 hypothetical protein [Rathayibacter iranicus NCPPB 2253 = VKM Ac-1602]PWJ61179.1 hypothetical protein B0H03_11916 [Rathayibacter iranicus NCPPB 2253 = VKM Ac-1602]